jgi:N-terminal helicase PWI domain
VKLSVRECAVCVCSSAKIAYITRLKQAQSDEDREKIRAEMRDDVSGGGAAILEALEKTQTAVNWAADRTGAYQTRVRKEAKALGGSGAASGLCCCFPLGVALH